MPLLKKSHPSQTTEPKQKKKSKSERKAAKKQQKLFLSAQDSIFYDQMLEDGMCIMSNNMYSRSYAFDDTNYMLSRKDDQIDTFTKMCEFYNSIATDTHCQITIINRCGDEDDFAEQMYYARMNDGYDVDRNIINQMLSDRFVEGNNGIIRNKYLTFCVNAESLAQARQNLARLESDVSVQFKDMGSSLYQLDGFHRLEAIHNQLNPDTPFNFEYSNLFISGGRTKDHICPSSFDFKAKRTFEFGNKVGQVLFASKLPDTISDTLLANISDLPIPLTISLHIDPIDQNEALEFVRKKIAFMDEEAAEKQRKASQSGYSAELALPHEFKFSYDQANSLVQNMEYKDQHLFRTTLLVFTYGNSEDELRKNVAQITSTARKASVEFIPLDYEQEYGLNSVFPLGQNFVQYRRTLTTASTAIFMPFMSVELRQPGGIVYGVNTRSNSLIAFDRAALNRASNAVFLGTPGSGKGMFAKQEIINVFLKRPNDDIIVIDPEGEYGPLARLYPDDAEIIQIYGGSETHLNPLDMSENYGDTQDPMVTKLDFMCSFIELLSKTGRTVGGLDGTSISIIDTALHETYLDYFANPDSAEMPTLVDFFNILSKMPDQRAHDIALQLQTYVTGSLNVFSYRTNVNINKRLIVFDIKQLGKHLRTVGMLTVLDQIWNRISTNREQQKRTWLYIDEMQLLFSNDYCSEYFFELWSRARKWGAVPTGITQNVETLLLSDNARRMLSNSDFVVMLNQAKSDSVQLANLLNIAPKQLEHVTNAQKGHGLMVVDGRIIPFNSEFPKGNRLYDAMTTKLDEVKPMQSHRQKPEHNVNQNQDVRNASTSFSELSDIIDRKYATMYSLNISVKADSFTSVDDNQPIFSSVGVPDVSFIIQSQDDGKTWNVRTDSSGSFILHVPAGTYMLTSTTIPNGYHLQDDDITRTIEVSADCLTEYHLLVNSTVLSVQVDSEESAKFNIPKDREIKLGLYTDQTLTAADGSQLDANTLVAEFDRSSDGLYTLETILTGKFYISESEGQKEDTVDVGLAPVAPRTAMQLEPMYIPLRYADFSGVKFNEDGDPLADSLVGLFDSNCTQFSDTNAIDITTTDAIGKYVFSIPTCLSDKKWKTKILC